VTDAVDAPDAAALLGALRSGDRRALAQAITLVESTRPDHRAAALALIDAALPHAGGALRLGISGPPGVGKSTFIEAFGLSLLALGRRVAVLAVDPTSSRTGGSILGDKTRMAELARAEEAFIRPSPSGGALGGVARRTREAMLLCEAAGFDTVLIETVGVGQSEIAVAGLVDLFVLLVPPGGGDELQGIKRGIMELADLIVVTKSDGDLAATATHTAADYRHALGLVRPKHKDVPAQVLQVSAIEGTGIDEVWATADRTADALRSSGVLDHQRGEQAVQWMWDEIDDALRDHLRSRHEDLRALEDEVRHGRLSPASAAKRALD
jgi:LAO/AO transport system kinase